MDKKERTK
jgi:hypothetical protein